MYAAYLYAQAPYTAYLAKATGGVQTLMQCISTAQKNACFATSLPQHAQMATDINGPIQREILLMQTHKALKPTQYSGPLVCPKIALYTSEIRS